MQHEMQLVVVANISKQFEEKTNQARSFSSISLHDVTFKVLAPRSLHAYA